jgi:hypothetical protein
LGEGGALAVVVGLVDLVGLGEVLGDDAEGRDATGSHGASGGGARADASAHGVAAAARERRGVGDGGHAERHRGVCRSFVVAGVCARRRMRVVARRGEPDVAYPLSCG